MKKLHSFHIPVMGIAYTIDTPLKVSQYGIDSVISLVDDILIEKIRKMYCEKFKIPYEEINEKIKDFRAKRITSYLNLINELAKKRFDDLKNTTIEKGDELKKYLTMLPETSIIRDKIKNFKTDFDLQKIANRIKDNLSMGSIDVNIMTKLDKENHLKGEKLPIECNDAHAALRGYAQSDLSSSIILSAGMSPKLYSYIEQFKDFYPDETGNIKKKIVLKVSDFRSALIQGKFLAKKGLWVSEFRIESGLNCGGHAFATDGLLMGPILNEFKSQRKKLKNEIKEIFNPALANKNYPIPKKDLKIKITAQGGVGTAEEHQFLIDQYGLDSVGWGSPFLLVPEATTIDEETMDRLIKAKENDLYLSNISPLGVPFNSLRGNSKDNEKIALIKEGKPGSSCPKRFLASNNELTKKYVCTASRPYQKIKLKELKNAGLSEEEYQSKCNEIYDKSCICVGLGTSALIANGLDTKVEGQGVSVCPGPNMAYFSKKMSLEEMTDHIYRKTKLNDERPHIFIKELNIYIDYLKKQIETFKTSRTNKQKTYFLKFIENLHKGISYYHDLFKNEKSFFKNERSGLLKDLNSGRTYLNMLKSKI